MHNQKSLANFTDYALSMRWLMCPERELLPTVKAENHQILDFWMSEIFLYHSGHLGLRKLLVFSETKQGVLANMRR